MRAILLLEDEPLIAMSIEDDLRSAGFTITTVGSCADAFTWLAGNRPDLVIVDIELRDGPSHTVVERLLQEDIPFVVHSGDVADALRGTQYEQRVWLSKPSMPDDLIAAARQATSVPQSP
jgi:DNA-binding response OmpR family regulator